MSDLQKDSSSTPDSPVVVGVVLGSHGVNGELRVRAMSDVPHRFDPGQVLFLADQPLTIVASSRGRADSLILRLEGIDSAAAAREFTGMELGCQAESAANLPEGEYFHYQLMGLQVITDEGEHLGRIAEIIVTGSNDVYLVQGDKGEILLPAVSQVVRQVNIGSGTMVVHLLDGLR